jgi:hypothetical protein
LQNLILTEQLSGRRNIAGSMYSVFAVADKLYRTIFDAQNSESLPRKLVCSEGGKHQKEEEEDVLLLKLMIILETLITFTKICLIEAQ